VGQRLPNNLTERSPDYSASGVVWLSDRPVFPSDALSTFTPPSAVMAHRGYSVPHGRFFAVVGMNAKQRAMTARVSFIQMGRLDSGRQD
jgi:hypothetical protein